MVIDNQSNMQQTRLSFTFSSRSSFSHFLAFRSKPLAANFKLNKCSLLSVNDNKHSVQQRQYMTDNKMRQQRHVLHAGVVYFGKLLFESNEQEFSQKS